MSKPRANGHRSRKGTNGKPTTAKHNDRDFDVSKAEHIQEDLIKQNEIYKYADIKGKEQLTLDQFEQKFYEQNFSEQLEKRNEKQIVDRHKNRVQTMEQFRKNAKFCPEESIWTIGNRDDKIPPEILKSAFEEFKKWHDEEFQNVVFLDAALHLDEPDAAPHIHARQVWFANCFENGKWHKEIGQAAALEEMGIERPEPTKKESRYNNAKVTYTAIVREKWLDICEAHGVDVEREPQNKSKSGLPLAKLKYNTLLQKIEEKESQIIALDLQIEDSTANLDSIHSAIQKAETEKAELEQQLNSVEREISDKQQSLKEIQDKALAYEQPPKKPLEKQVAYEVRVATGQQAVAILQREQSSADIRNKLEADRAKTQAEFESKQAKLDTMAKQVEHNNKIVNDRKAKLDLDILRQDKIVAAEARRQAQKILDNNGIQLPDNLLVEQMTAYRAVERTIDNDSKHKGDVSK